MPAMRVSLNFKRLLPLLCASFLLLPAIEALAAPQTSGSTAMPTTALRDGRHDFDFLAGRWYAHSRRLTKPLANSNEWVEFDSVHDGVLLPGGFGVSDDYRIEGRPDFHGLALQVYDPATRQWQAWWYRLGVLTSPLHGAFTDGVGVFEGPDELDGRPIVTRYTWSRITATTARWEQAFSADGGSTWETNWVMEYRRAKPSAKE
jgi:hypothetical protein